jgi:hypothetical protein
MSPKINESATSPRRYNGFSEKEKGRVDEI